MDFDPIWVTRYLLIFNNVHTAIQILFWQSLNRFLFLDISLPSNKIFFMTFLCTKNWLQAIFQGGFLNLSYTRVYSDKDFSHTCLPSILSHFKSISHFRQFRRIWNWSEKHGENFLINFIRILVKAICQSSYVVSIEYSLLMMHTQFDIFHYRSIFCKHASKLALYKLK